MLALPKYEVPPEKYPPPAPTQTTLTLYTPAGHVHVYVWALLAVTEEVAYTVEVKRCEPVDWLTWAVWNSP